MFVMVSGTCSVGSVTDKHKVGYNARWTTDFHDIFRCMTLTILVVIVRLQLSVSCVRFASGTAQSRGTTLERGQTSRAKL